jgi:hypothetical protein
VFQEQLAGHKEMTPEEFAAYKRLITKQGELKPETTVEKTPAQKLAEYAAKLASESTEEYQGGSPPVPVQEKPKKVIPR